MAKKLIARAAHDFSLGSFRTVLEIEERHIAAGFPALPAGLIARRYWQYIRFLQTQGFTTRAILDSPSALVPDTDLRNSDLTSEGYVFAQLTFDKWLNRSRKDAGEIAEEKWLKKWLLKVKEHWSGELS